MKREMKRETRFPDYKQGSIDIVYSRLKANTLKVNFQTGEVYSFHAWNKKWTKLSFNYDAAEDKQRYAFVMIRKCCISFRKDSLGRSRKIVTWRRKKISVHKLVWIAAYGPGSIPRDHQIHHKNNNSLINGLFNLELMHKHKHSDLHNGNGNGNGNNSNHEPW